MGGQGAQVFSFFVFYDLVGEGDGDGAVGFFVVGLVGAAAVVAGAADTEVVVAGDGGDASFADLVNDFVGPDIVAYEVAEAVDGIGFLLIDVCKEGFERGQVGVDVGE